MKVSIAECKDYKNVMPAIEKCLEPLGGINRFVRPGMKVLLKPNQLSGKGPEHAITTHPSIVKAVAKLVIEAGGKPTVGDSPGIFGLYAVASKTGIKQICDELNIPLLDLGTPELTKFAKGRRIKAFHISKFLKDFDLIINLPKLKTHMLCTVTLAVKNLYGCIAGKNKAAYHLRFKSKQLFSEMLLDLWEMVKPQLNIIDAVIGMEGQGPSAGDIIEVGYIIASTNSLALDTVASDMMGIKDVPLLSIAKKYGYREADINNIDVIGKYKRFKFKLPDSSRSWVMHIPFRDKLLKKLTARPVATDKCIRCGHCKEICPNDAITIKEKAIFNYDRCIRCYCCHEICPKNAINLEKGHLARIIDRITR